MTFGAYEFIWHPPRDWEVLWTRNWSTGFQASVAGNEEREYRRGVGLKSLEWTAQPASFVERVDLFASVVAALRSGKAAAPYWGRSSVLALDCSGTTVTLEDNVWGWAALETIFLFDQNSRQFEVRTISGVVGNVLTLSGAAVARTYKAGTLVWPVIYGELSCDNAGLITNERAEPNLTLTEVENGFSKVESNCPVLTTYLGRPVAPLDVEGAWIDREQSQTFQFDLRKIQLGFGGPSYLPLQNHLVNGWELTAILDGAANIKAWDCLTAGLPGMAAGFWLCDREMVFEIVTSPAANTVRVTEEGLAALWAADPAIYVVFKKEGQADKFAGITAVVSLGGGLEEVTLDAAVSVDVTWLAYRLRYVRLASDIEKGRFIVENRMAREIRVIELPEEYAAIETNRAPVWLYTFWIETPGGNTYWRYTSYADNLTSNGNVFASFPGGLSHGEIKRSMTPQQDDVEIEAVRDGTNVFNFFAPLTLPLNLWVQIEEATIGALNVTEVLFVGILQRAPMAGRKVTAKASSAIDVLGAEAPNFTLQPRCNYRVFGAGCLLDRADYEIPVEIALISADRLTVDVKGHLGAINGNNVNGFAIAQANYWAFGWLELGAAAAYQVASILSSAVQAVSIGGGPTNQGARLRLSLPLQAAAAIGDLATLRPGCDGTQTACQAKFHNFINFGAQPYMPQDNPSIPNLDADYQSASKK